MKINKICRHLQKINEIFRTVRNGYINVFLSNFNSDKQVRVLSTPRFAVPIFIPIHSDPITAKKYSATK